MSTPDSIIDVHRKFEYSMARLAGLQDAQNALRRDTRKYLDTHPSMPGLMHAINRLDHLIRERLDYQATLVDQMYWAEGEVRS